MSTFTLNYVVILNMRSQVSVNLRTNRVVHDLFALKITKNRLNEAWTDAYSTIFKNSLILPNTVQDLPDASLFPHKTLAGRRNFTYSTIYRIIDRTHYTSAWGRGRGRVSNLYVIYFFTLAFLKSCLLINSIIKCRLFVKKL